jgi:predicted RNA binding protein YcfA (HicA-like mRNA interferase family)
MPSLPVVSGSDAVKVFERFGWTVARQSSSHIIMTKEGEIAFTLNPEPQRSCKRNTAESHSFGKSNCG